DIGRALAALQQRKDAIAAFDQAIRLEKVATTKADLRRSVAALRKAENIDAQNLGRQPRIHSTIEQSGLVRPRLPLPQAGPPPAKAPPPKRPAPRPAATRRVS